MIPNEGGIITMKRWTSIGPEWKTEDIYRVRQILRDEHIPFKMPFYDVFFANTFNMPSEDRRWGILVRVKDLEKVITLLIREGLACRALWEDFAGEPCRDKSPERAPGVLSPVPSR